MKKITLILLAILATTIFSYSQKNSKFLNKTIEFTASAMDIYDTETSELFQSLDVSFQVIISKKKIEIFSENHETYIIQEYIETRKIENLGTAKYWYAKDKNGGMCQIGICQYMKDKKIYVLAATYADYYWVYTLKNNK